MISTHRIVQTIQNSCYHISKLIRDTNSLELSTVTNQMNQSAETVKQLDEFANSHLLQSLRNLPEIRMIGSEEESELISVNPQGRYLVCFDPLDGSSNIDVNITIGTIFAIYEYPSSENSLTCGNQIVSAGYCLYGSSTQFVFANREQGVSIFQLQEGVFEEIRTNFFMPEKGSIVSHNQSNATTYLDPRIQCFIDELIVEKHYSSRYVGSLVADAHRTLLKGGVFLYPANQSYTCGKIRLLYEAYPMAFIFECAGGVATNGDIELLHIPFPENPHERTPIYLSSRNESILLSSL